ncbi:hypothetical protein [Amycolatopsis sp. NPDC049159]|uniref:hypothetical protein n=1 Tax=Amycolatopsis sp. NPDC049159 TaxID=3157210 RepID=UPI0033DEE8D4
MGTQLARLVLALIVGAVFLLASLPKGATALAQREDWEWLTEPATASRWLDATLSGVPGLLTWLGYALLGYLGALLLVSLRHWRPDLFAIGVVVAALTAVLPHLLGCVGFVIFKVGAFVATVLIAVFGFFGGIGRAVRDFVVFLFTSWWWVVPAIVFVGVLVLWRHAAKKWVKPLAVALAWVVGAIAVFGGLGLLLGLVPQGFWDALGAVVVVVVQVVLALLAVATVGQLFVDQLRSTAIAGSGRKGVVMGAIAVGSALAVLMLIGNVSTPTTGTRTRWRPGSRCTCGATARRAWTPRSPSWSWVFRRSASSATSGG